MSGNESYSTVIPLDVQFDARSPGATTSTAVEFPAGAAQGPQVWWIGNVSYSFLAQSSGPAGNYYIDCSTNGSSAFLLEFTREEDGSVTVGFNGTVGGAQTLVVPADGPPLTFEYRNHLRRDGVISGKSTFDCTTRGTDIGLTTASVGPVTIVDTLDNPRPIETRLEASPFDTSGHATITVYVRSVDPRPLGDVRINVHAGTDSDQVSIDQPTLVLHAGDGKEASTTVKLTSPHRSSTAAPLPVEMEASNAVGASRSVISVYTEVASERNWIGLAGLGLGLGLVAVGIWSRYFSARHRRTPLTDSSEGG